MKKKTIYIADDGKEFDTETACLKYEKLGAEAVKRENRLREIQIERRAQLAIKDNAFSWMQVMKSGNNTCQVKPTISNVTNCISNLSRIEAIYKNAKKEFFKDINMPGLNLKERAYRISHSARVLGMAIDKRNEILECWTECKKDVANANKRLAELNEEEAKLMTEKKTDE